MSNNGKRKAMKSSKKLQRATKSKNGHQSWKSKRGNKKPKRAGKGTKSPDGKNDAKKLQNRTRTHEQADIWTD